MDVLSTLVQGLLGIAVYIALVMVVAKIALYQVEKKLDRIIELLSSGSR